MKNTVSDQKYIHVDWLIFSSNQVNSKY